LAWAIEYTETAQRQLRKFDKSEARRILDFLDQRIAKLEDPRTLGNAMQGSLGAFWTYRVGDYRVLCDIQDANVRVLVIRIGNRKEVYR
jgi:mRNA interferase RelE/StbE